MKTIICFSSHTSLPVTLENTSNAHTTGTETHTDPPMGSPAGQHLEANTSHMLKEQVRNSDPCDLSSLYLRKCPSFNFLIIFDRTSAPLSPQTQIPV